MAKEKHMPIAPSLDAIYERQNIDTLALWSDYLAAATIPTIRYKNLPITIDNIYLERGFFNHGQMLIFEADGVLVCCKGYGTSDPNNYEIPYYREVHAINGLTATLTPENSVLIYDNVQKTTPITIATIYASRLAQLDRVMDVNINAQKTPVILKGPQAKLLSMVNVVKDYDGNIPYMLFDEDWEEDAFKVLNLNAPFNADKIRGIQKDILSEYFVRVGITPLSPDKAERQNVPEILLGSSGISSFRNSRLDPRNQGLALAAELFPQHFPGGPAIAYYEDDILERIDNTQEIRKEDDEEDEQIHNNA